MTAFTRRIATEIVDPLSIDAFVACTLIPLNKYPGIRPIEVCETVRRIIGKSIIALIKLDVLTATGAAQLCAGQVAGFEAAIHALNSLYATSNNEGVRLDDASNASNSLNRQVALQNVAVTCPVIYPVLANTYQTPCQLFVGGETLLLQEGTTQNDPLALAMYALATVPLIDKIQLTNSYQVRYADDAAAGGNRLLSNNGELILSTHWSQIWLFSQH